MKLALLILATFWIGCTPSSPHYEFRGNNPNLTTIDTFDYRLSKSDLKKYKENKIKPDSLSNSK